MGIGTFAAETARALTARQASATQMEKRNDLMNSTLNGYIEGMGRKLLLVIKIFDRVPLQICGIADLDDAGPSKNYAHVTQARASLLYRLNNSSRLCGSQASSTEV